MTTHNPSIDEIRGAIRSLFKPEQVVELRGLGVSGETAPKTFVLSGVYDDFDKLAQDAVRVCDTAGVFGTYFTIQELKPALLLRSPNRYRRVGKGECTADEDITGYRWLPLDFDPVRAAGISSTDEEKAAAHAVMLRVSEFFSSFGVGSIQGDSGNGYHLLVAIELTMEDKTLVSRVLMALNDRYSTDAVNIDATVFNPARIWKAYGTIAKKGFPSVERPHRISRLLQIPDAIPAPISRELLEQIAAEIPTEPEKKKGKKLSSAEIQWAVEKLEEFMEEAKIEHGDRVEYKDGFKWSLAVCPFDPSHVAPSIVVTIAESGAAGFRCLHNSCFLKKWKDFRAHGEAIIGHEFKFKKEIPASDPDAIVCGPGLLKEMIRRSEIVLHGYGLKYFERLGSLVNTAYGRDVPKLKDIERDADSVIIIRASDETIVRDLDNKATYVIRTETKDGTLDTRIAVPSLSGQIHDRVRSEPRDVPYPSLDMVTGSPVLLPTGAVHGGNEIFKESVLFVNAHTRKYLPVPESPSRDDALAALKQFEDIFGSFPFVDPEHTLTPLRTSSYSVALCGPLSLAARPYMGIGAIPIIVVSAPSRRSGKTKIVEAGCMSAVSHRPTAAHFTDEEELGKHLQPLMVAGDRAILLDNVERTLQSSKLCVLVTGGVLRDRVLGKSEDVILQNHAVIFATGNNITLGGDLAARAIRCDIDPAMEYPESRGFDFDPVARAAERHPQLVHALLVVLRAYLVAGMPWKLDRKPWGGFERWDKLVCGCLTWLGLADPYLARERILADDPIRAVNMDILEAWYLRYKNRVVSFADIQKDKNEVYDSLLTDGAWDGYRARWTLHRMAGRYIGGYRLVRSGKSRYQVLRAGEQIPFDEAMNS